MWATYHKKYIFNLHFILPQKTYKIKLEKIKLKIYKIKIKLKIHMKREREKKPTVYM